MSEISTISPSQRTAIEALLSGKDRAATAEAAGVSERAIYKWLSRPDFRDALREQSAIAHSYALARLIGSIGKAIDTLQGGCDGSANATQVRAATAIVNSVVTLNASMEQEARIQEALERLGRLEEQQQQDGRNGTEHTSHVRAWNNGKGTPGGPSPHPAS